MYFTPGQMAQIYWTYKRQTALTEIREKIKQYAPSTNTMTYWGEVIRLLESF